MFPNIEMFTWDTWYEELILLSVTAVTHKKKPLVSGFALNAHNSYSTIQANLSSNGAPCLVRCSLSAWMASSNLDIR